MRSMKTSCILFWVIAVLFFHLPPGYGYYHPETRTDGLRIPGISESAGKAQTLGVYDNFIDPPRSMPSSPVLLPVSRDYPPALVINANPRVHTALQNYGIIDNSLASILYANLKLRELIEDYAALQARARKLLADFSVPFLESRPKNPATTDDNGSIHQDVRSIRRQLDEVLSDLNRPGTKTVSIDSGPLSSLRPTSMVARSHRLNIPDLANGLAPIQMESQPGANTASTTVALDQNLRPTSKGKDDSLPWLFEVAFELINFVLANKVQVAAYTVFFFLMTTLIAGLISRKLKK